mmetsp:Transcript_28834/g.49074  ORF Transcript_28834/g.49074 Transcript_28834/m.49074 type:complete len:336 (+) Transcript_28834:909-1916(+)
MASNRLEYRSIFSCPISPSRPLSISSTSSSAELSPPNNDLEASPSYSMCEASRNSSKCSSPSGCVLSISSMNRITLSHEPSFPHVHSVHCPNDLSKSESSSSWLETVPEASASTASKILRAATTQESSRPSAFTFMAPLLPLLLASSCSSLENIKSPATRTGPRSSYKTLNANVTFGSLMAASVPVSNPRYLEDVTRLMSASEWRRKLESMASKRWAALLSGCAGGSTASTITTSTPGSALLSSCARGGGDSSTSTRALSSSPELLSSLVLSSLSNAADDVSIVFCVCSLTLNFRFRKSLQSFRSLARLPPTALTPSVLPSLSATATGDDASIIF